VAGIMNDKTYLELVRDAGLRNASELIAPDYQASVTTTLNIQQRQLQNFLAIECSHDALVSTISGFNWVPVISCFSSY